MTHSREPGAGAQDGGETAADGAATQPAQPEEHSDGQHPGAATPGSFNPGGPPQFPIPPQAWTDDAQRQQQPSAAQAPASGRGATSGAPLPPGPFFPPAQPSVEPSRPESAPNAGANPVPTSWEPPPSVDWHPEPAPSRGGRRRRARDAAAQQSPGGFAPQQPVQYPGQWPSQSYEQPQQQQPSYEQQAPPQQQPSYDLPPPQPPSQPSYGQSSPQQQQQPYDQQQPQQQQFARAPRPEDLLAPTARPADAEPASWGWRGRVNRGSGGLIKPKVGADELAVRNAIERIQYGFSRPMTVVVVQPKGGAGKTPTTICLSSAFGAYRGGYVVGWDDNETRGTLAVRVSNSGNQTTTVWDLLSDVDAFERSDARVGDLGHYVRAQPDAHFDALVSDDSPSNMSQIGEDEFERLHRVLGRFYRMIVVDTGNNVRSPNWQAAVNAADLVVVVSSYQRDVGYSGSWVLDHLAQTGRGDLARNAITVLTAADPTTDEEVRAQLLEHFKSRTRAVAEIPYDSALAHGGPIRWTEMAPATRNAWTLAAATVVDALAEQDRAQRQ